MNSILVPLDTSEAAAKAIGPAMELAEALDHTLLLLAVSDVIVTNAMRPVMESERITVEQALKSYLGQHVSSLEGRGVGIEALVLDAGDPAAAIIDTAEGRGVAMIVMCSHGRSGAARWLLGSTADRVVRSSPVPVHLVPVR